MNWLKYLLEANLYLSLFYALYVVLLATQTYHKLNRIYLLAICCISWIIPLVQFGFLIKPLNYNANLPATGVNNIANTDQAGTAVQHTQLLSLQNLLPGLYLAGAFVVFLIFIYKLYRILKLTRSNNIMRANDYSLIRLNNSNTAYSFFKYVFIGDQVADEKIILSHELTHIEQRHSIDILFVEIIKIICWFNPLVYLLKRSLKTVHEYIADEKTASFENNPIAYSSFLLDNAYGLNGPSVSHSFFNYNLLKKRIIMLNKTRSGSLARLKYLVTVPLLGAMLFTSTLAFSKTYGWINIAPAKTAAAINIKKKDTVYSTVETLPEFPGGMNALLTYVAKNTRYPKKAVENKIEGKVIVNFIIEKDGSITNVKPYRNLSPDLDQEAMRVIRSMPKWKPGAQGGKPVRTAYTMPITFALPPQ